MSVEPSEATSEVWTRWQGHVINGTFPLGRCLGSSDHSGVFLTRSAAFSSSELAIKLVPTNRALAEELLPRWKRAGGLAHPNLLPLLQWGGCQLEGLPYLYALMEYADQTLAQLLQQRALTADEAREMLPSILDALAYLHRQDLVQGQLKPGNILVVGDQLRLASDTVRRLGEGTLSTHTPTAYDPPEGRQGSTSPASDIWALGVTLFEALARRLPPAPGEPGEAIALPADFSPSLREVVARCLSPDPHARADVTELEALVRGASVESVPVATAEPTALAPPEPSAPEPGTPEPGAPESGTPDRAAPEATGEFTFSAAPPAPALPQDGPEVARPAPPMEKSPNSRGLLGVVVGPLVVIALIWAGVRLFSGHRAPAPPPLPVQAPRAPAATAAGTPVSGGSPTQPARSEVATPAALHEVVPEVPWGARRTIRGHIKVWVRVIVNPDGSVFAAVPDRAGPSRYFQRLALEAAKKWTFAPADTPSQRLWQVRFDFSRDGTTGRAVTLH
ncbi:MAG: serine/threonine-protein kinase [Steroidobacteraceae bacterium]